jgi:hypothetical protein
VTGSCLRNPDDIVTQKQRIPRHAVYLADLECVDAAKNGRVPAYKQRSRTNGSTDEIPVMDTETEEWPIPSKHEDEFDSMKFDFMACPRCTSESDIITCATRNSICFRQKYSKLESYNQAAQSRRLAPSAATLAKDR